MAVHFDPRASSVQGTNAQVNLNARPAPSGVAGTPNTIMSQASETSGCSGWIAKICEWIRSLFSSAPSLPSLEERKQKGREVIDRVFQFPPQCDPDRTVMVCELRYHDEVSVVFRKMSTGEDRFKDECYRRLSNLLINHEQIGDGKLSVKSYFCEKLPDRIHYRTTENRKIIDFREMQTDNGGASAGHVLIASVINDVRQIYNPNPNDGVPLVQLITTL